MEHLPKKQEESIDTLLGVNTAEITLNKNSEVVLEIEEKSKEIEQIENPAQKVLAFLELSKEARERGVSGLASKLNRRAVETDNQNKEFFEEDAKERLNKIKDQISTFRGSNYELNKKYNNMGELTQSAKDVILENSEKQDQKPVKIKKSIVKTLASTLKSFFSF